MTLYQLVKNELKRGDVQKISDIIGVTHSGATSVLNNKNFDSVRYLLAVCEVTGKPIEYFLSVFKQYVDTVSEPLEPYGLSTYEELFEAYKKEIKKNDDLIKELNHVKTAYIEVLEKLLPNGPED